MSPDQFERILAFHYQLKACRKDPANAPEPDILLLLGLERGPIGHIDVGTIDGTPWLWLRTHSTKCPLFPLRPEVAHAAFLLLMLEGSMFPNNNGKGLEYLSIFSGDDTVPLPRIVLDPKAGEVVKQRDPRNPGYDPESLYLAHVDVVRAQEGKPMRTPGTGRTYAASVARGNYHRAYAGSGLKGLTAERYQTMIMEAYGFIDARYAERVRRRQERGLIVPPHPRPFPVPAYGFPFADEVETPEAA